MNELALDDPRYLWLLPAALVVLPVGVLGLWLRQRALRQFAAPGLLPRLAPPVSWARGLVRLGLAGLCMVLLTAAIVGPRWGEREEALTRRGIDVMVVLDVSRSMLARDVAPSRLERARIAIRDDLLPALGGDRVGLVAFAGSAVLLCPLTSDYGFFRLALEDATPAVVPRGGTMIGDAIRRAGESFDKEFDSYRLILLITDGEAHDSYPVEAATAAWQDMAIPVVAIAIGDSGEGARVPVDAANGERYLQHEGRTVWSVADFEQLRQIAAAPGLNRFIPVGTRDFDLGEIYRSAVVPFVDVREREERERVPLPSQAHWPAWAALLVLLVDSLLREGRRGPAAAGLRAARRAA